MNEQLKIPRMMTIKEAAKILGLPVYFIRRKIAEGEIIAVRSGNKFLVNLDKLVEYLNTARIVPNEAIDN